MTLPSPFLSAIYQTVAFDFDEIEVDETRITCKRRKGAYDSEIIRLDFGSFDYFRNSTKSVTLSLPWRGVWRSKGVDEECLEVNLF